MPPALVALALVATLIPAASRAVFGRPLGLASAWLGALAAAALAQGAGEVLALRVGVVGDAQLLLAAVGATIATFIVAATERAGRARRG